MNKVECPYCHALSIDIEFCDDCGKRISYLNEINSNQNQSDLSTISLNESNFDDSNSNANSLNVNDLNESELNNEVHLNDKFIGLNSLNEKWNESSINYECYTVEVNNKINTNIILNEDYVEMPFLCEESSDKYLLYFKKDNNTENLETWINNNENLSILDKLNIVRRISSIVQNINHKRYIVGTFDLSDFWIKNNDINSIFFRVIRPFYSNGQLINNMNIGEFCAIEVKHNDESNINYSSDVFIIGNLFIKLILKDFNISDYSELSYITHQLDLFELNLPVRLHKWIGRSTSIVLKNRFRRVSDQLKQLNKILYIEKKHECDSSDTKYKVEFASQTNAGDGKRSRASKNIDEDLLNEDRIITLNRCEDGTNRFLAIVADGISKCKYGCGAHAAQHVINSAEYLWNTMSKNLNSYDDVNEFTKKLIIESNRRILEEVNNDYSALVDINNITSSEVMGSTLAAVFIINDTVYSISLGDSRTYLHSVNGINLIHCDDNLMNEKLKDDISWDEIEGMDENYSLTNNVGKVISKENDQLFFRMKQFNLYSDELLLLCSDGLTDYINSDEYGNDEWNVDKKIEEIISTEKNSRNSLNRICTKLVDEANENGGGDNISVIVMRITKENNK